MLPDRVQQGQKDSLQTPVVNPLARLNSGEPKRGAQRDQPERRLTNMDILTQAHAARTLGRVRLARFSGHDATAQLLDELAGEYHKGALKLSRHRRHRLRAVANERLRMFGGRQG